MRLPALSIRTRLVLLALAAITLAQAIGLALSIWQEVSRYAVAKRDALIGTAETFAAAAARGVSLGDSDLAYQAVRAMGRVPGIAFVEVLDAGGRSLADLGAMEQLAGDLVIADPTAPLPILDLVRSRSVEIAVPIVSEGREVGRLRLVADTADLAGQIMTAARLAGVGALAALLAALAVALRMQRAITAPLLALTAGMGRVQRSHDYTLSVPKRGEDEIGVLTDGFNAMLADIRERDGKLARHRERLEQDVADRTRDYQEAAAAADSANAAKSDFLATMSHEIRTPMNGILVMAELLAKAELPKHARRQAEVIARSGESLLAIINDILDFSKIEAGKLDVETMELDAGRAVEAVMRLFADRAQSKGLDLAAHIELPPGAVVAADPVRIGQVLGNLVNNALKFTETGGVTVIAAYDRKLPGMARFSVVDTGIGIPADKIGGLFERFAQAEQSTARHYGGTGLGLSIARKLVLAMGGEITVTSRQGEGSCFAFTLPLGATSNQRDWPRIAAAIPAEARAVVSIAEPATERLVAAYLLAAGFRVETAPESAFATVAPGARVVIASLQRLARLPRLATRADGGVLAVAKPAEDIRPAFDGGRIDAALPWPVMRADLAEAIEAMAAGRPLRSLAEGSTSAAETAPRFVGLRVLVADDSEVNREVAQAALQKLGIAPDFAEDGRQALEAALAQRYDLVLMDGSMPELDGFEATRLIRSREAAEGRRRTAVVALTAHVVGEAADAWRDAGMDGVLHKPFTLAQLADCLAAHAGPGAPDAPAIEAPSPVPAAEIEERTPALDRKALDELRAMASGSPEIVERIVRLYRAQSADRLGDLHAAAQAGDLDRLAKAAHALKSMSLNIGARQVAEAAGVLEKQARVDGSAASTAAMAALDADLSQAIAALDDHLAGAA